MKVPLLGRSWKNVVKTAHTCMWGIELPVARGGPHGGAWSKIIFLLWLDGVVMNPSREGSSDRAAYDKPS